MNYNEARTLLEKYHQEHILNFYNELDDNEKQQLLRDVEETDFSVIVKSRSGNSSQGSIAPLKAMEIDEIDSRKDEFKECGIEAIKCGEVGAVLLAGGMGTRLGSDSPKGCFDIGLTKPVFIFQRLFENLQEVVKEAGCHIPLFIMTSHLNSAETIDFLRDHSFFGYDERYIAFFNQDKAPSTDFEGRVLMSSKCTIANAPNGNGGWFSSLVRSKAYEKLSEEGGTFSNIKWLNAFAVDNVLQRIADPVFTGASILSEVTSGAKVVRKAAPDEKVGVMCLEDGHPSIVEYYELTDELMNAKDERGEPAYNFGVIFNYIFRLDELRKKADVDMPLHIVKKKIHYIDDNGKLIIPESENAYKYETLSLDMIRLMDSCLPFEVVREREFAPIKNATGIDSVESARELCRLNGIEL